MTEMVPNLLIPENKQVLAKMKQINVYHELVLPFVWEKVNHDRVHSDYTGVMMDTAADLPGNCKYVVYGFPALVHPDSGIIFGYAIGMGIQYRVPETIAREYRMYLEKKYAHLRPRKKKSTNVSDPINASPPLESNWVDGGSFTSNFLHKLYAFYSGSQSQSNVMHLNVDEDLRKEPPPPPFYDKWLDRLFFVLVLLGALLVIVLILDAMDGFQLVRQVLNLLQQR